MEINNPRKNLKKTDIYVTGMKNKWGKKVIVESILDYKRLNFPDFYEEMSQ